MHYRTKVILSAEEIELYLFAGHGIFEVFFFQIIKSLLVSLHEVAVLVLLVSATNLDITAGLLGKEKVFETFNGEKRRSHD